MYNYDSLQTKHVLPQQKRTNYDHEVRLVMQQSKIHHQRHKNYYLKADSTQVHMCPASALNSSAKMAAQQSNFCFNWNMIVIYPL